MNVVFWIPFLGLLAQSALPVVLGLVGTAAVSIGFLVLFKELILPTLISVFFLGLGVFIVYGTMKANLAAKEFNYRALGFSMVLFLLLAGAAIYVPNYLPKLLMSVAPSAGALQSTAPITANPAEAVQPAADANLFVEGVKPYVLPIILAGVLGLIGYAGKKRRKRR